MRASGEIVLTEVPPATVPTVNVVFGDFGVCISAIFAIAHGLRRDDQAGQAR